MKVLVVGGAGYVGGYLVDLLLEHGHDVDVYDCLLYEDQYLKPVNFTRGDIRNSEVLHEKGSKSDCVIWLAALVGDPACSIDPDLTRAVNTFALANFVKNFDGKLIFLSTCSVYGAQEGLLTEDSPTNPLS